MPINKEAVTPLSEYMLIYDIKPTKHVTTKKQSWHDDDCIVWKGKFVNEVGSGRPMQNVQPRTVDTVYFRRDYREDYELDRMFPEFSVHDTSLCGNVFIAVPKHKLLLGVFDSVTKAGIILPTPGAGKVRGRNG